MTKIHIPLNLQLFAEEKEIEDIEEFDLDELEVDFEDEQEQDEHEQADDQENEQENEQTDGQDDEQGNEQEQEKPEEVEKTVPLKALEAERNKWKSRLEDPALQKKLALAERILAATGKDADSLVADLDKIAVEQRVQAGMDPAKAAALVAEERRLAEERRAVNKAKYDLEVSKLKQNPFFADIDDHREELEMFAERTGLTLEAAYMATRGAQRMIEREREIEQRILNKVKPKKVDTSSNGEAEVKPKVNLTKDEIALAKMAGMTPQEYYNLKKISTPDQYKKLKK